MKVRTNEELEKIFDGISFEKFKNLGDYDNITIVDQDGIIIFYDFADLNHLKLLSIVPDEMVGSKITSVWADLDDDNSTLMRVVHTGKEILDNKQIHKTKGGRIVYTVNSIFPFFADGKIVGAIEFNRFYFNKEDIKLLHNYSPHKIYRKNNTIYTVENIITQNSNMMKIKDKMNRASKTDSSILIYGETGTGKEMVAQSIHNLSDRFNMKYVSVNCGAIPLTLFESLMFGTVKGSFTGSDNTVGLLEEANGGTLFLDEINSLDMSLQVKLLKAIEEKVIRKVGGSRYIPIDIRVIAATNENPEELVQRGKLREDLFYRLGVVQIDLPTLDTRKEDIPILVDSFINFYNGKMNINITDVHPDVMKKFYEYDWPGNIRELKNAIEYAYNSVTGSEITLEDIPKKIRRCRNKSNIDIQNKGLSLVEMIEKYEKQIILDELEKMNYKKTDTAKNLGISKQLLNYKINKYSLE
ncbi:sigma-54 interaction domain-containing protein [Tissierellaceae bacterium HCP3S3_D8]